MSVAMGQQEVSESTNTAVANPSSLRRVASAGMSKIKRFKTSVRSYFINQNSNLHRDGPNLGHHNDHNDLEAHGTSSVKGKPTISTTTTSSSSSTTHFHLSSSQTSTATRPDDFSPKPTCVCECRCRQTETPTLSNSMAQAFRQLELGKSFLSFIMPISTIMLAIPNKGSSPQLVTWTLCLNCVALVALFSGNLLRNMLPKTSNAFEQLGTACLFSSFFMAVGSHLPLTLAWFPFTCFLTCILMSVGSCLPLQKLRRAIVSFFQKVTKP